MEGKAKSSQNSLKHGLSAKIDKKRFGETFDAIHKALIEEGLPVSSAHDLALRILDLERNLDFQRMIFLQDRRSSKAVQADLNQALSEQFPETDDLIEILSGVPDGLFSLTPEDTREGRKLFDEAKRFLIRTERTRQAQEKRSSLRYLTRSANRLARSLKGF